MICKNCGENISDGSKLCGNCGTSVNIDKSNEKKPFWLNIKTLVLIIVLVILLVVLIIYLTIQKKEKDFNNNVSLLMSDWQTQSGDTITFSYEDPNGYQTQVEMDIQAIAKEDGHIYIYNINTLADYFPNIYYSAEDYTTAKVPSNYSDLKSDYEVEINISGNYLYVEDISEHTLTLTDDNGTSITLTK